jgi:hypothetical protein
MMQIPDQAKDPSKAAKKTVLRSGKESDYSIFGIGVDRRHYAKWLFPQEKATSQCS